MHSIRTLGGADAKLSVKSVYATAATTKYYPLLKAVLMPTWIGWLALPQAESSFMPSPGAMAAADPLPPLSCEESRHSTLELTGRDGRPLRARLSDGLGVTARNLKVPCLYALSIAW